MSPSILEEFLNKTGIQSQMQFDYNFEEVIDQLDSNPHNESVTTKGTSDKDDEVESLQTKQDDDDVAELLIEQEPRIQDTEHQSIFTDVPASSMTLVHFRKQEIAQSNYISYQDETEQLEENQPNTNEMESTTITGNSDDIIQELCLDTYILG